MNINYFIFWLKPQDNKNQRKENNKNISEKESLRVILSAISIKRRVERNLKSSDFIEYKTEQVFIKTNNTFIWNTQHVCKYPALILVHLAQFENDVRNDYKKNS